MVSRIFPCVPLPDPGAPTSRIVRYFIVLTLCVLVANLDGLDLDERNHHLGGRVGALELQVHFVRGDAADSSPDIFASHGFDYQEQVLFRFAWHHAKESGKLGFKKATVKREPAPR